MGLAHYLGGGVRADLQLREWCVDVTAVTVQAGNMRGLLLPSKEHKLPWFFCLFLFLIE